MDISSPHYIKSMWCSIFRRKGESGGTTDLFDAFDDETQKSMLENIALATDELPVIGCRPEKDDWFLLTTKRLVVCHGRSFRVVNTMDITSVTSGEMRQTRKTEMALLTITARGGEELTFRAGAGPAFFGILSVLMHVALYRQAERRIPWRSP